MSDESNKAKEALTPITWPTVKWLKPQHTAAVGEDTRRAWVGLTDEDIEMIVENKRAAHWEFVRQVEALLKEKNT